MRKEKQLSVFIGEIFVGSGSSKSNETEGKKEVKDHFGVKVFDLDLSSAHQTHTQF